MIDAWLVANIFHDVDLPAFWPTVFRYVVAEHPERRPDALTFRDLDTRFESAIRLGEKILRLESRRSVVASDAIRASEFFLLSGDDQIAVLDFHVLRARSVGLELLIAPAVAAKIVCPLSRIGGRAVGRREFIGPSERPIWSRRRNAGSGSCRSSFFVRCYGHHRRLHSFPTPRSPVPALAAG